MDPDTPNVVGRSAKQNRDRALLFLSPLIILLCFAMLGAMLWIPMVPNTDRTLVGQIAGSVINLLVFVAGYWYGTSKGSADKAEEMAKP